MTGTRDGALGVALVGLIEIDDLEERLTGPAQIPRVGLSAVPAITVLTASDIVICLGVVSCEIPRLAKVIRIVLDEFVRDVVTAAHRMRAHGQGIDACYPRTALCGANGRASKGMRVAETLLGEGIDIRSLCFRIAVTTYPVDVGIFTDEPKNVWVVGCFCPTDEKYYSDAQARGEFHFLLDFVVSWGRSFKQAGSGAAGVPVTSVGAVNK